VLGHLRGATVGLMVAAASTRPAAATWGRLHTLAAASSQGWRAGGTGLVAQRLLSSTGAQLLALLMMEEVELLLLQQAGVRRAASTRPAQATWALLLHTLAAVLRRPWRSWWGSCCMSSPAYVAHSC
jgi:hypothetical protein